MRLIMGVTGQGGGIGLVDTNLCFQEIRVFEASWAWVGAFVGREANATK
jgi:hypothetical protein